MSKSPSNTKEFPWGDEFKLRRRTARLERPENREIQALRTFPRLHNDETIPLDYFDFWQ